MQRLCPNCEELLKVDAVGPHDPVLGRCAGCGWTGPITQGRQEPMLPETPPKLPYVSIDIETTGLDPATCQTLEIGAVLDDWKTPINQLPRFRRVLAYEHVTGSPYAMAMNTGLLKMIGNAPKDPPLPPEEALATWIEKCGIDTALPQGRILHLLNNKPLPWWAIPNVLLHAMMAHPVPEILCIAADPPGTSCFCSPVEATILFLAWLKAHGIDPKGVQAAGKNFASFDARFLSRLPNFDKAIKFRHRILDPAILFWRPLEDERLPDSKTCYERAGINSKVAHTAVEDALAVVRLVRTGVKRLPGMNPHVSR